MMRADALPAGQMRRWRRIAAAIVAVLLLGGALTTALARRDEARPPESGSLHRETMCLTTASS